MTSGVMVTEIEGLRGHAGTARGSRLTLANALVVGNFGPAVLFEAAREGHARTTGRTEEGA